MIWLFVSRIQKMIFIVPIGSSRSLCEIGLAAMKYCIAFLLLCVSCASNAHGEDGTFADFDIGLDKEVRRENMRPLRDFEERTAKRDVVVHARWLRLRGLELKSIAVVERIRSLVLPANANEYYSKVSSRKGEDDHPVLSGGVMAKKRETIKFLFRHPDSEQFQASCFLRHAESHLNRVDLRAAIINSPSQWRSPGYTLSTPLELFEEKGDAVRCERNLQGDTRYTLLVGGGASKFRLTLSESVDGLPTVFEIFVKAKDEENPGQFELRRVPETRTDWKKRDGQWFPDVVQMEAHSVFGKREHQMYEQVKVEFVEFDLEPKFDPKMYEDSEIKSFDLANELNKASKALLENTTGK